MRWVGRGVRWVGRERGEVGWEGGEVGIGEGGGRGGGGWEVWGKQRSGDGVEVEGVEGRGGGGRREGWRLWWFTHDLGYNRPTGYISDGKWMTEERLSVNKGMPIVSLSREEYHHRGNHRQ